MRRIIGYSGLLIGLLIIVWQGLSLRQAYATQKTLTPLKVVLRTLPVEGRDSMILYTEDISGDGVEDTFYHQLGFGDLQEVVADSIQDYPHVLSPTVFLHLDTTITSMAGQDVRYLYWVNNSGVVFHADRVDNHLAGGAEVQLDQRWRPIHHVPAVFCGNSLGTAPLNAQQFSRFDVPVYMGPIKVPMRYALYSRDTVLYSNTIQAYIHPDQVLERKSLFQW